MVKFEQQFWCETQQEGIEGETENISGVSEGGEKWHGVHGPVVAEGGGAQQQHEVEDGQVDEGESPGEETLTVWGGIVRPGECWQLAAQQYRPEAEDDDEAEEDPHQAAPLLVCGEASVGEVQQTADGQHGDALLLAQHGQCGQQGRGQTPAVLVVHTEGQQGEQSGHHLRPPHHARHRLGVDGQDREDQPGHLAQPGLGGQWADQPAEQEGH